MLDIGHISGDLRVQDGTLKIVPDSMTPNGNVTGYIDKTGVLTIDIPGHGTIQANGFLTRADIGQGHEGNRGNEGSNGTDGSIGLDGSKGVIGDRGEVGSRGVPGVRGPRGMQGSFGQNGNSGAEGVKGDDAFVNMFIQESDPGAPGAGAVWVKPIYTHLQEAIADIQANCSSDEDEDTEELPVIEGDSESHPYTSDGHATGSLVVYFDTSTYTTLEDSGKEFIRVEEEERFILILRLLSPLPIDAVFQVKLREDPTNIAWAGFKWDSDDAKGTVERTLTIPAGKLVSDELTAYVPEDWVIASDSGYGELAISSDSGNNQIMIDESTYQFVSDSPKLNYIKMRVYPKIS